MSVDAILEAVWSLSEEERAEFDARLNAGPIAAEAEMSPELAALLDERAAEADSNADGRGYTLEEVIAHVKRKR